VKLQERARDLQRVMPFLMVLGIVYFAALLAWAVADFGSYRANSRPAAPLSSPWLLAVGTFIVGVGLVVRQQGVWLFGLAMVLCGVGHGLALVRLGPGAIWPLTLGILLGSVAVALVSLVVQLRERRRSSSRL
jgi:hypothetical protein